MEKKDLFIFAEKILKSCPEVKAKSVLKQLELLLIEQGESEDIIELISDMTLYIGEMAGEVKKTDRLTDAEVAIAIRRGKERLTRETMARNYGRC